MNILYDNNNDMTYNECSDRPSRVELNYYLIHVYVTVSNFAECFRCVESLEATILYSMLKWYKQ